MKKSLTPVLGVCALCFGTLVSAFAAPKVEAKATVKPVTKIAAKPVVKKKHKAKKVVAKKTVAKKTVKVAAAPKVVAKKK